MAPASARFRGPQYRSGSLCGHGPLSRLPQIAGQGRFFGAPWWPPPARFSEALNFGLAARAGVGRYLGPPNSSPRLLFRGTLVAPTSALLRGPQYRSASPHGPESLNPRIAVEGRFFGLPQGPPPANALLRGPQFRSGSWPALIFYLQPGYRSQQRQ